MSENQLIETKISAEKKPFLTIGMPTFDDYHGVYFSVQALRMYHSEIMDEVEILIIDNNPNGAHGKELKSFAGWAKNVRYIPHEKSIGPAGSKGVVFEEAQAPYVLCMDGHILFEQGVLKKLVDFYKQHPETQDLYQGPLVYDDLGNISTHFEPQWRGQMYGTWATDDRGRNKEGDPFEIGMTGCGIMSCRKDAWLGFNKRWRGFGGEEGYIHEKFKQNGRKCWCLPFLRWVHRFGRPDGVKYVLTLENKVRNYFLGHAELGLDHEPIIEHFKEFYPEEKLKQIRDAAIEEIKADNLLLSAKTAKENAVVDAEYV